MRVLIDFVPSLKTSSKLEIGTAKYCVVTLSVLLSSGQCINRVRGLFYAEGWEDMRGV